MPFTVLSQDLAAAAPVTTIGAPLTSVGMTLAALREEIQALVGERDDVTPARIDLWINESYTDLCTSLQIDELKASIALELVVGQPRYLLPPVVWTTLGAALLLPRADSLNEGYPLNKTDLSTYRSWLAEDADPHSYFRYGNMLVLWPTPDEERTLALDFRVKPVWLTEETHSPFLGVEWHEAIKIGARRRAHSAVREFDLAAATEQEYVALVRRRMNREAEEQENMVVGSSVPRKLSDVRNRVHRTLLED